MKTRIYAAPAVKGLSNKSAWSQIKQNDVGNFDPLEVCSGSDTQLKV